MERLTRTEIQRLAEKTPEILKLYEMLLAAIFDGLGGHWSECKLRVGAAMSAVELASHSRLEKRRALWHAAMVLMVLRGTDADDDTARLLDQMAAIAHTLSLTVIACDSEVATPEAISMARTFIDGLGEGPLVWERLVRAHREVG